MQILGIETDCPIIQREGLNPVDATAILGQESKRAKLAMLYG